MNAEESFKAWYYKEGADWNAAHIKPVWMAAFAAAKESCADVCDEMDKERGYEVTAFECALAIRAL